MATKPETQGTVLITGAAKRIGKAICLLLSSHGYKIALHYNNSADEANKVSEEVRKGGGQCQLFCCDLADEQQTQQLIANVCKVCPDLNILINNASLFEPSTIANSTFESLKKNFAINLNAPFILTSQFAKECKKGHIINILDTHITHSSTRHSTYLLSKKALWSLTQMSALEFAPNIRVNALSPGLILPPEDKDPGYLDRLSKNVPMQRTGNANDIAHAILFLLSNPYITGENIFIDGGEHLVQS